MKNIEIKTINECKLMTKKELEKYFEKYTDWNFEYSHKLAEIVEKGENYEYKKHYKEFLYENDKEEKKINKIEATRGRE